MTKIKYTKRINQPMIKETEEIILYNGGKEAFPRIIERIEKAEKSIVTGMFVWREDKIGTQIAEKLIEASKRGVKIHIIKDKLAMVFELSEENKQSLFHNEFDIKLMSQAFVMDIFYPMKGKSKYRKQTKSSIYKQLVNNENIKVDKDTVLSDHSKYYVFDDSTLIMGGMNIEDKSIHTDVEGKEYIDFMVELNNNKYVEKFYDKINYNKQQNQNNIDFIVNLKNNTKRNFEIKNKMLELLSSAKESVTIVMAYIGDKDITDKIIEIANKGIDITFLMPEKANLQNDLNLKVLKKIMKQTNNKINIYLSKKMVHAKMIIIDEQIVTFGSANINKNGMTKLSELNILINKSNYKEFDEKLKTSLEKNFENTTKITAANMIKYNPVKAMIEQLIWPSHKSLYCYVYLVTSYSSHILHYAHDDIGNVRKKYVIIF